MKKYPFVKHVWITLNKDCTHLNIQELKEKIIKDSNSEKNNKNYLDCIEQTETQVKDQSLKKRKKKTKETGK
jgi:hypothetical protein